MIGGIKGKGCSESLEYIHRMTRKASVEITDDPADSSVQVSLPQSGVFFWKQVFIEIDANGDFTISKDEFEAAAAESSIAKSLLSLFESADSADRTTEAAEKQRPDHSALQTDDSPIARMFKAIDADSDGTVSESELAEAKAQILRRMQNSMARLQLELTEAFLNMLETAGSIGCREGVLVNQSSPSVAQTGSGEAEGTFKKIDANLDGEISRDELVKALSETQEKLDRTSSRET
jgi:Ca2+-binding EF-hand superfamily protein